MHVNRTVPPVVAVDVNGSTVTSGRRGDEGGVTIDNKVKDLYLKQTYNVQVNRSIYIR